jgi:mono/diheme cytochrome c family protein
MSARSIARCALLVAPIATSALGQGLGDPVAGERLAATNCTQCHGDLDVPAGGPAFATVAADPSKSEDELTRFLATPHATMSSIDLSWEDRRDLAAYIPSLRP